MNVNSLIESKFMKASDLNGEDQIVTIKDVDFAEVGQDKQKKPVIFFKGIPKGMVLNKTNIQALEMATGESDTDDWAGKRVTLYEGETTDPSGKLVPCLRIKSKAPKDAKPAEAAKEVGKPKRGDSDDLLAGLPEKAIKYMRNRKNPEGRPLTPADEMDADGEDNPFHDSEWVPF